MDPPLSAMAASLVDEPPITALSTSTTKIRLMCSYGGHIVNRPHCKSLCYAGGETRMVAVDRRTSAASLVSLFAHLSRTLCHSRPFHLKYQLPNEELDSLISVTTDEDLQNMLEEHDRISSSKSPRPSRIRLFLFPVKSESLGSALIDSKSESWLSDALNNSAIVRRVQSTDSGLPRGLAGVDTVNASDPVPVDGQADNSSNSGDAKHGLEHSGAVHESMVLETSSSFGSTNSSVSMSNLQAIGVHCEESNADLIEKRLRVPSSASIESDISVSSVGIQPKPAMYQEPFVHVVSGATTSCTVEPESPISNSSTFIQTQKILQAPQNGMQYVHGGPYYIPQYPTTPSPLSSHYPVYQVPMQQSPYVFNQQCPIYLVPMQPSSSLHMPAQGRVNDIATVSPNPQGYMIPPSISQKDILTAQQVPSVKVCRTCPISTAPVTAPSNQGQQQLVGHLEPQLSSQPVSTETKYSDEFDDDLSYSQIYKSQPPAPTFISQCQAITKGQVDNSTVISAIPK